ncbi:DUF1194 domain-containing protein [uncultured Tateyamaria sp.]|uniref:DUF1194 domain-containing protein n=1 Tax=Tateyamaria sp. 1078 TaxID=3417464 RepID=UPI00260D6B7A|nr:DUF1194 domain-containing protein [uncultured Tateyamaria sp.]
MKFALATLLALTVSAAEAGCRQALALGLDVSGSVDAREYRLQIDGLAAALGAQPVHDALMQMPGTPVELLIYEWSGPDNPAVILPWTAITSPTVLAAVQAQLRATERRTASPGTALGLAMREGLRHLQARRNCWKRTLDISGDGKSNLGPRPQFEREAFATTDIVINALVIGADSPSIGDLRQAEVSGLSRYFQAEVIWGAGSFVETALGFEDYAAAMARKLERELEAVIVGRASEER